MNSSAAPQLKPAQGLPAKLVVVICIVTVTEALAGNVIWPFLPSAVQRWGATEEQTGIYVGLLASAFFLAQVLFVVHWGRAADRFGRRPALLVGLAGTILCTLLFGVADSFALALLSRFLIGALNGNVALTKVYVGECADKATIAKAFSYLSFSWGIGVISAPALGGLLADPAEQFPETFGDSPFWKRFPYLLPNLIPAAWAAFALAVGYWGLPETAVWQRRHAARVAAARSGDAAAAPAEMAVELAQLHAGSGSNAGQGAEDESPLADTVVVNAVAAPAASVAPDAVAAARPRLLSGSSNASGLPRSKTGASTQRSAAVSASAAGLPRSKSGASARGSAEPRQPQGDEGELAEGQGAGANPVPRGLMRALSIASESEREHDAAAAATELSIGDAVGLASSDTSGFGTADSPSDSTAAFSGRGRLSRSASASTQTAVSEADSAALTRNDATARAVAPVRTTPRSSSSTSTSASDRDAQSSEPLGPPVPEGASLREVFADHAMRTSILAYGLLAVAQVQFDELVPVLLRLDTHLGGLGFTARETGAVQVVAGAAQIFGQIFILAPVTARYGPIRCFLRTMLPLVALLLFPVVALFGDSRGGTWALLALFLIAKTLLMQVAFTSIMIVINNSTRGFNLGLVTGLAQAVASGVRAVGPTVGGGLFSASLQWRSLGALRMHAAFVTVACCIVAGFCMGKRIPRWADSPPDYAAETAAAPSTSAAAAGDAGQPEASDDNCVIQSNAGGQGQSQSLAPALSRNARATAAQAKAAAALPLPSAKSSASGRVAPPATSFKKAASAAPSTTQSALANHADDLELEL